MAMDRGAQGMDKMSELIPRKVAVNLDNELQVPLTKGGDVGGHTDLLMALWMWWPA
jgi:hypothetical protein